MSKPGIHASSGSGGVHMTRSVGSRGVERSWLFVGLVCAGIVGTVTAAGHVSDAFAKSSNSGSSKSTIQTRVTVPVRVIPPPPAPAPVSSRAPSTTAGSASPPRNNAATANKSNAAKDDDDDDDRRAPTAAARVTKPAAPNRRDDDDDDRPAASAQSKPAANRGAPRVRAGAERNDRRSSEPPKTMVEVLERLFEPETPPTPRAAEATAAAPVTTGSLPSVRPLFGGPPAVSVDRPAAAPLAKSVAPVPVQVPTSLPTTPGKTATSPAVTNGKVTPASGPGVGGSATNDKEKETVAIPAPPNTAAKSSTTAKVKPPLVPLTPTKISGGASTYSKTEVLAVNVSPKALNEARRLGFTTDPTATHPRIGTAVTRLRPPHGMHILHAHRMLQRSLPNDQIVLNRIYRIYRPANDNGIPKPGQVEQVALPNEKERCREDRCMARQLIGWKEALPTCSRGLRIGVIDTAIDLEHPAFPPGRVQIGTFIPQDRRPAANWHGTGVLALLAGNPRGGTPGLIPQASFYAANIFFTDEGGGHATDTVSLLNALEWMSAFDVKVVNMSFAGPKDEVVESAITRLANDGMIFVAAAGNEGPTAAPSYPAAYAPVIAVTAVGSDLSTYAYASRGDHIDVAAPGVDIWTAVPGSRQGYLSGTSFAVPYVTAVLASVYGQTQQHKKESLLASLTVKDLGPPGRDAIYGRGLLMAPGHCNPASGGVISASAPAATSRTSPATAAAAAGWQPTSIIGRPAGGGASGVSAGFR
jgi:hypothetical protein